MGAFPIGRQRVGIVTPGGPILDGDGKPTYSEIMEPLTSDPTVEWVDGCSFEIQTSATTPSEQTGITDTTAEVAWVLMPVVDGRVPLVNADGTPAGTKAITAITATLGLRDAETGKDYLMQHDAIHEPPPAEHVFCRVQRLVG